MTRTAPPASSPAAGPPSGRAVVVLLGGAAAVGVACETRHIRDKAPAEGIMETAQLEDCDLIVMASHGRRGLRKMMLGSQTAEVLTHSKTPVLVLR